MSFEDFKSGLQDFKLVADPLYSNGAEYQNNNGATALVIVIFHD